MQAPVLSWQTQQSRAQRLLGMWDTLVMGSIFSGFPMLTCNTVTDGYQHTHHRVTNTPTTGLPSHPPRGYHHTHNRVTITPTTGLPTHLQHGYHSNQGSDNTVTSYQHTYNMVTIVTKAATTW